MRSNDGFVFGWGQTLPDAINVKAYDADGTPATNLNRIFTPGPVGVNGSDIVLQVGSASVSDPLVAQAFDLEANALGPVYEVSPAPPGQIFGLSPAVAPGSDGNFLVVWSLTNQTVHARLLSSLGEPLGGVFELSTVTPPDAGPFAFSQVDCEGHPDGGYTASWTVELPFNPGVGSVESQLLARSVSALGSALGQPLDVRPAGAGVVRVQALGAGQDWAFTAVWNETSNGPLLGFSFVALAASVFTAQGAIVLGVLLLLTIRLRGAPSGR
jgi:hypothetical protein